MVTPKIMDLYARQTIYNALTEKAARERNGPFGKESIVAKDCEIIADRLGRGALVILELVPDYPGKQ